MTSARVQEANMSNIISEGNLLIISSVLQSICAVLSRHPLRGASDERISYSLSGYLVPTSR
jgi:hypothetical protein